MQAVHHDVAGAEPVDDLGQRDGKGFAVHVNHQRGLAGIVQALAHTDAEEGRILAHQAIRNLALDSHGLAKDACRQSRRSGKGNDQRRGSKCHGMGIGGEDVYKRQLVENVEDMIAKMTALKSHGLSFSVDDFGTGYSSLAYLKRLPLDQLKIDHAFVRDILADAGSGAIAQTIISLGKAMGLSVIAEGVETCLLYTSRCV